MIWSSPIEKLCSKRANVDGPTHELESSEHPKKNVASGINWPLQNDIAREGPCFTSCLKKVGLLVHDAERHRGVKHLFLWFCCIATWWDDQICDVVIWKQALLLISHLCRFPSEKKMHSVEKNVVLLNTTFVQCWRCHAHKCLAKPSQTSGFCCLALSTFPTFLLKLLHLLLMLQSTCACPNFFPHWPLVSLLCNRRTSGGGSAGCCRCCVSGMTPTTTVVRHA